MNDNDKRQSMLDKMLDSVKEEKTDRVQNSIVDILHDIKENPKTYKSILISSPILAILFSSWLMQILYRAVGKQDSIYIVDFFTAWTSSPLGILIAIFLTLFFISLQFRFHKVTQKDYYVDREGNFEISKSGVHGKAHWQTEEEREVCFERSKKYDDIKGNILGIDDNGLLYALRSDLVGINKNKIIIGVPGSGKSAAIIENDIMKCMERGESAIITDSKGDLYRKLSKKAIENGYIVRVLNVKPNELKHSDAFHLLKYLEDGNISSAMMLANAIIEMTSGHMDYWGKNELNGYVALLLYISTNETYRASGENTLGKMYELCSKHNPQQLALLFDGLDDSHPAKQAFNIFLEAEPRIQGQILNGMGINLSFMIDNYAKEILSHDEIDLVLPMKRKCMYFVVIPDNNKTFNVIANLFFNMMITKQCEFSDSLPDDVRKSRQLCVNYILDEFKATGSISNFDDVVSTVRSRKMAITVVLQSLGQLEDMYPGKACETILGGMTTRILLRAGDEYTARYFSVLCGKQTRRVVTGKYNESLSDAVPLHDGENMSVSLVGADLLPIDEAMKLDANKLVVCILGFEPVKLNKYLSHNNPYLQEWEERMPGRHKPKWRKLQEDKIKEREARREAAKHANDGDKEGDPKPEGENSQGNPPPDDPAQGDPAQGDPAQGDTGNAGNPAGNDPSPGNAEDPQSSTDGDPQGSTQDNDNTHAEDKEKDAESIPGLPEAPKNSPPKKRGKFVLIEK